MVEFVGWMGFHFPMSEHAPLTKPAVGAPAAPRQQRQAGPWSVPNLLTYARILIVPLVVLCFDLEERGKSSDVMRWSALGLFVLASVTDFFDGYLARSWQQTSALGRMLDPIADKLLVSACLLLLAADGTIAGWTIWAAIVILSREILVSGLREFLADVKVAVPVSQLAKWKTTLQMVAVSFLLAGPAGDKIFPYCTQIGIGLLWVAAIVTLITGYDYFRHGLKHMIPADEDQDGLK
ncbi:MAG: CDP-diacylglycerol--glycerol-3-phosphate 3-phosphatidyltransferase [Pseudomonadota bacterium]